MLDIGVLLFEFLPRILLAIFCGSLIGLEREMKDKPAGMRTYMLICAGATIFTMIGVYFTEQGTGNGTGDPLRVAAQIVTGVGFLGAGTIIFAKGYVKGLTSAAAIWMSAAIGMAIGVGMLVFSMMVTLLVILSLVLLRRVERVLGLKGRRKYRYTVMLRKEALDTLQRMILRSGRCDIVEIAGVSEGINVVIECELSRLEKVSLEKGISKIGNEFSIKIE
jgi:putative Mg2+ transporter-C (MgtC) family protein